MNDHHQPGHPLGKCEAKLQLICLVSSIKQVLTLAQTKCCPDTVSSLGCPQITHHCHPQIIKFMLQTSKGSYSLGWGLLYIQSATSFTFFFQHPSLYFLSKILLFDMKCIFTLCTGNSQASISYPTPINSTFGAAAAAAAMVGSREINHNFHDKSSAWLIHKSVEQI